MSPSFSFFFLFVCCCVVVVVCLFVYFLGRSVEDEKSTKQLIVEALYLDLEDLKQSKFLYVFLFILGLFRSK